MAVDYQTPLIINVKNAKILIKTIVRHYDFEILNMNYRTGHRTVVLSELINVAAFVPDVTISNSNDFQQVTQASIAVGFSMVRIMSLRIEESLTDVRMLKIAQSNSRKEAFCDYNFSIVATSINAEQVSQVINEVEFLFILFNHLSDNISKVAAITAHFTA